VIVRAESKMGLLFVLSVWVVSVCVGKMIVRTESRLWLVVVLSVLVGYVCVWKDEC
jgi:hypothetical protein